MDGSHYDWRHDTRRRLGGDDPGQQPPGLAQVSREIAMTVMAVLLALGAVLIIDSLKLGPVMAPAPDVIWE